MPRIVGPAGKIALQTVLPPDIEAPEIWDVPSIKKVFTEVALKHPDKYPELAEHYKQLGRVGATLSTGYTFSLSDLLPRDVLHEYRQEVDTAVRKYFQKRPFMDKQDETLAQELHEITNKYYDKLVKVLEKEDNPIYRIVAAKIRGNPTTIKRFLLSDGVSADNYGRLIPYPIFNNYSIGMDPPEYWAAAYGSKQGIVMTKLAPGDAGYFYKQLAQVTHKLLVTDDDGPVVGKLRGMPVSTDDDDSIGAYLAADVGGFKAGTLITPQVLNKIRSQRFKTILVRSPIAGGPPQGVYAKDAGYRGGSLPGKGTIVGLEAAQAIGERVSQSSVGKKHQGSVAGGISSATELLDRLVNVPQNFAGGATHARTDGMVSAIRKAPAGGHYIVIGNEEHFVPEGVELKVKVGDKVEAGDILSGGIPNPAVITYYKGIGEGRRYFTDLWTSVIRGFGWPAHRRNVELIARGLIDHVLFTQAHDKYLPGELISYNVLEHTWKPRPGTREVSLAEAKHQYLEEPVLHYTIGTRVTPAVLEMLKKFGISKVKVHKDPPPFVPKMIRAEVAVTYDPDWLVRLFGAYQKRSLQEAAAYGGVSNKYGVSFVPSLAEGVEFGREWPARVQQSRLP